MKIAGAWLLLVTVALVATFVWLGAVPQDQRLAPSIATGIVVFSAIFSVVFMRKRSEKASLSAAEHSFEREQAVKAQARTFIDALVLGVLVLAILLVFQVQALSWLLLLAYMAVLIADFFIRFRLQLRAGD